MEKELSKRTRGVLRQLAATAHEREVREHLKSLAEAFSGWEKGRVETWDLVEQMHQFMQGPSRKLFTQYNTRGIVYMSVAAAIVRGVLSEEEVPPDVLAALERPIAFYRQELADG